MCIEGRSDAADKEFGATADGPPVVENPHRAIGDETVDPRVVYAR